MKIPAVNRFLGFIKYVKKLLEKYSAEYTMRDYYVMYQYIRNNGWTFNISAFYCSIISISCYWI